MTKNRNGTVNIRQTGGPSGSVYDHLALISYCFVEIAKQETGRRDMKRVHAVRAGLVATAAAANLLGIALPTNGELEI
jgi:hypothetical protein